LLAMSVTGVQAAHHSEQKRNRICLFASWPLLPYSAAAGDDMLRGGVGVGVGVDVRVRARGVARAVSSAVAGE
jgi:hypothetical protein